MSIGGNIFADADAGPVQASGGFDANLAFGPTSSNASSRHPLYPDDGFAWGFWLGVSALVLLCFVRHNLPA